MITRNELRTQIGDIAYKWATESRNTFLGSGECADKILALPVIEAAPDMLDAMKWFVARVDAGEVRSQRTYALFKGIIARAEVAND
jgi:hypothetical protein